MTDWYYAWLGEQVGPVQQEDLQGLIEAGTVTPDTLVWREGMADWQRLAEVDHLLAEAPAPAAGDANAAAPIPTGGAVASPDADEGGPTVPRQRCVECGLRFDPAEMVEYAGTYVCAGCKPLFFQRVKEGADLPNRLRYGGFWIRFGAKMIDGIILWVVGLILGTLATALSFSGADPMAEMMIQVILIPVQIVMAVAYITYFLGRFGATPGKMACGLRVVRPDGSRISYGRAFCRYFGEQLSTIIIFLGYVMAAFDDEKRTLHDRLCDTRVVYR